MAEQSKPEVAVTIVSRGDIKGCTVLDLVSLLRDTQTATPIFSYVEGSYIPRNRQHAAFLAGVNGVDYLMFVDGDMRFPPNGLDRLLSANLDVVGCNYHVRGPMASNTMVNFEGERVSSQKAPDKYEEARSIGLGFCLIKTSFLSTLQEPKFFCPYDLEAMDFASEDVWFCERTREAGGKVMVDHELSCEIRHIVGASCELETL